MQKEGKSTLNYQRLAATWGPKMASAGIPLPKWTPCRVHRKRLPKGCKGRSRTHTYLFATLNNELRTACASEAPVQPSRTSFWVVIPGPGTSHARRTSLARVFFGFSCVPLEGLKGVGFRQGERLRLGVPYRMVSGSSGSSHSDGWEPRNVG